MVRHFVMALALTATTAMTAAPADDAEDVNLLKAKVEALEAKLEAATLKIETLQKQNDQLRFEGWWEVVTMDDGRGPTPHRDKDLIRDGLLYHTGTLRNEDPGQPIRLDPTKSPKAFDVEWSPGKFYHGIYRIECDALTLCYGYPGQPRPTEFAGSGGTTYCVIYRRMAAEKSAK